MYECVMGLRKHEGQGCILADEMYCFLTSDVFAYKTNTLTRGMGKTLQTITLIWTLLSESLLVGHQPEIHLPLFRAKLL